MVKVVAWGSTSRRIGALSISVDQMIGIIESHNIKEVSAKKTYWKKTIHFESIDDIKKNKARLSGNPLFYLDGVNLEFSFGAAKLWFWLSDKESHKEDLMLSLYHELAAHKSSMDKIFDFCYKLYIPTLTFLLLSAIFKGKFESYINLNGDKLATFVFLPCLAIVLINGSRVLRSGITYTPVPGFWTRHGSNIAAGLIGAIVLGWLGVVGKILMSGAKP
ncbi:hypothetical protein ABID19_001213 [Mesorhizobium robiniae]|uniref:Uncharacterized protein n=1 Tax=Mesorhizobium robiniae TaxID=559315 RepID=A0ABV2GIT0_9HYPH